MGATGDTVRLGTVDLFFIFAYLLTVVGLALWMSRGVRTGRDLFLAGKSLPWWAVGTSLVVSDIGAKDMVGLATDGYRFGMVMMNFDFIGCILPVLVAAFVFMPYLWMAGVYTVPEYLGLRYDSRVRTFFAILWCFFMLTVLGTVFHSAGTIYRDLLGFDYWTALIVSAVLVGAYTWLGGLKAVVITDFVSCLVLMAGAGAICGFGLAEVGGWSGLRESLAQHDWTDHHFDLILPADSPTGYGWPAVLLGLGFVMGPAYWIGNQAIVQRAFGTRSQQEARASYVLCAVIKLVFPVLLVLPGLIAVALLFDQFGVPVDATGAALDSSEWEGDGILASLVVRLLPTGFLGIVLGAFLAGALSNLDSYVNSASTMFVNDIYGAFVRPQASETERLRVGRALIIVFLILGLGAAILVDRSASVFQAFQTALSLIQGSLFALLLGGMLTERATATAGVAATGAGVGTAAFLTFGHHFGLWENAIHFLWPAWWSFVAAITTLAVVSPFTEAHDRERLRGLVYWLPKEESPA